MRIGVHIKVYRQDYLSRRQAKVIIYHNQEISVDEIVGVKNCRKSQDGRTHQTRNVGCNFQGFVCVSVPGLGGGGLANEIFHLA